MKTAKTILLSSAASVTAILCITALLVAFNAFDLRYWLASKTGSFYPDPIEINNTNDVEEMWGVSLPEGSYIEGWSAIRNSEIPTEIKYVPYNYNVRVSIPSEKTVDFADSLRDKYSDDTFDDFGDKKELGYFPEIVKDLEGKELTYCFSHIENISSDSEIRTHIHRSIYIFEEDGKTTVYFS